MHRVNRVNSNLSDIDDGIFRAVGKRGDIDSVVRHGLSAGATVVVVEGTDGHIHFVTNDASLNLGDVIFRALPTSHVRSRGHVSFHLEAEQFALETLRAHMYPVRP